MPPFRYGLNQISLCSSYLTTSQASLQHHRMGLTALGGLLTWGYRQLPQPPPNCSRPESSPGSPPWLQGGTAGNSDQWQRGLESSYPRGDHPHPKTSAGFTISQFGSGSRLVCQSHCAPKWARHALPTLSHLPSNQWCPMLTPLGPSTVSRGNPRQTTAVTYSITDT